MRAMAPLIENEVRFALSIEANVETANGLVRARYPHVRRGADAYNEINRALTLILALTAAKLFELPAPRGKQTPAERDLRSDVASIPLLVNLLRDPAHQRELIEEARQWTPSLAGAQAKACSRAIRGAIAAFGFCETDKGKAVLAKFKDLRNKAVAHTLTSVLGALPTYDELFRLIDVAKSVQGHAALAVRGHNVDLNLHEKRMTESALDFWTPSFAALATAQSQD